jgi:hypothetical protein
LFDLQWTFPYLPVTPVEYGPGSLIFAGWGGKTPICANLHEKHIVSFDPPASYTVYGQGINGFT